MSHGDVDPSVPDQLPCAFFVSTLKIFLLRWKIHLSSIQMQRPVPRTDQAIFLDLDNTLLCTVPNEEVPLSWYQENIRNNPENYHIQTRSFVLSLPHGSGRADFWGTYRPHMKEFLMYCFWRFKYVIIWSAGSKSYVHALVDKIFKDLPRPDMILNHDHCDKLNGLTLKSLPRLIANLNHPEITLEKSYFIDDLEHNFRHNPGNGIVIPEYRPHHEKLCPRDTALSDLCVWFDQPEVQSVDDVRKLDKSRIFKDRVV